MNKIIHNNKIGYRDTIEDAEKTIRERMKNAHGERAVLLVSQCDVVRGGMRIVMVYYSPVADKYDLVIFEQCEGEKLDD